LPVYNINAMRKTIFILIAWIALPTGLGVFQACCNPQPNNFVLKSIGGNAMRITGRAVSTSWPQERFIFEPYRSSGHGVSYDSLGIEIQHEVESLVSLQVSGLVTPLFACSPVDNYEYLRDLVVTSNRDYNRLFPAGSNLKDLLSFRRGGFGMYPVQGSPASLFIANLELSQSGIFITFKAAPDARAVHNLTVKYILVNNREYTLEFPGITINR